MFVVFFLNLTCSRKPFTLIVRGFFCTFETKSQITFIMKAINFEEANLQIAEHQEEYQTLPAFVNKDEGSVTFGFELDPEELAQVMKTGKIFFKQMTGGGSMQPVSMSPSKAVLIPGSSEEEGNNEGLEKALKAMKTFVFDWRQNAHHASDEPTSEGVHNRFKIQDITIVTVDEEDEEGFSSESRKAIVIENSVDYDNEGKKLD